MSALFPLLLLSLPTRSALAADLDVDGTTVTLNGAYTYDNIRVINGGVIYVTDYSGSGTTGTLSLTADSITIDATSSIIADGAGYRGRLNTSGEGPGGGAGGSSVRDSGGGGGHGGAGGTGKGDGCSGTQGAGGSAYGSSSSTAVGMGSAGGAAGSADGDSGGYGANGGGAIMLYATTITMAGTIRSDGDAGTVINNDATGGGAGGGIVLQADVLSCTGTLRARGGNGGSTDDGGGGGGGGVINQFYDSSGTTCTPVLTAGTGGCGGSGTTGGTGAGGSSILDWDGDGYTHNDGDCDTDDASIYPGATETCDGVDNDCDGTADESTASDASAWYLDFDHDGYGDAAAVVTACTQPTGYVDNSDDCDDSDSSINPSANEECDGIDNDCDGNIDEDDAIDVSTWYRDADSDTYGDPGSTDIDCTQPTGYVATAGDCNDASAAVNPGASEVCNSIDDDCDGTVDEDSAIDALTWYRDADADNYGNPSITDIECQQPSGFVADNTDCNDAASSINPGASETWYNGVDENCDGNDDDRDLDGYASTAVTGGTDCNDLDASVHPGATDTWYDGIDSDCAGNSDYDQDGDGQDSADHGGIDCDDLDASIYDGATDAWYDGVDSDCEGNSDFDADRDGYDSASYGGTDCDDAVATTHPGAPDDPYDGVDSDCLGDGDYDADGDGYTSAEYGGDDCDDNNSDINPGEEETWYDGVDDDCDGNDDDQDEDGYPVDEDCDDTDPSVAEDCGEDTGDTGLDNVDTGDGPNVDTGGLSNDPLDPDGAYEGGACGGCATAPGGSAAPIGGGLLALLAGLLGWRRRR